MNWSGRQMHQLLAQSNSSPKKVLSERRQIDLKKQTQLIYEKAEELQKLIRKLYMVQQKKPQLLSYRKRLRQSSKSKPRSAVKSIIVKSQSFRMDTSSPQKQIKKNFLRIKQTHLEDLMRRISLIKQSPETLELKFCQYWENDHQQFLNTLKSDQLKDTKILIIYWPSVVDDHTYFQKMSDTLVTLPKLQSFKIISNGENSKNAFKSLGKKFTSIVDRQWWKKQQWRQ